MNDLDIKIEKTRTLLSNLNSFKDWSFAAYKIEEHEKDAAIDALTYALSAYLKMKEETHDNTEVCE